MRTDYQKASRKEPRKKNQPHAFAIMPSSGNFFGFRQCQRRPDLLSIEQTTETELTLIQLGSQSQLHVYDAARSKPAIRNSTYQSKPTPVPGNARRRTWVFRWRPVGLNRQSRHSRKTVAPPEFWLAASR